MNSVVLFVVVALAGGVGAGARYTLDGLIRSLVKGGGLPWGTIVINLTGSFALGLAMGFAARGLLPHDWLLVAGTGFLGGYTTFSTASFETVRLLQERRYVLGAVNGVGVLAAGVAAAACGMWVGRV